MIDFNPVIHLYFLGVFLKEGLNLIGWFGHLNTLICN